MRILLIEDELSIRTDIKQIENKNMKITEAINGQEGIKKLTQHTYDIILLDLIMPIKDGFAVLEAIKELEYKSKIILITSFNSTKVIKQTAEYDIDYVVAKPFNLKDLIKKLNITEQAKTLPEKIIDIELCKLKIPIHHKGYKYIKDALLIINTSEEYKIKTIYEQIAHQNQTNPSSVERNIRHSIEKSFENIDIYHDNILKNYILDSNKSKLSNREYLSALSKHIM